MKKILFLVLFLGMYIGLPARADGDFLFEEIVIPSAQTPAGTFVKQTDETSIRTSQKPAKYKAKEDKADKKRKKTKARLQRKNITVDNKFAQPIVDMIGKYNNDIKVIYTDIDGTIIPENYKDILYKESVTNAFSKLEKNHIPVVFTTGRTYQDAKDFADAVEINPEFYVTQDGAEIVDENGLLLYKKNMKNKFKKKINHEVKWFNIFYNQNVKIIFYQKGKAYTYSDKVSYKAVDLPFVDSPIVIDKFSELPKKEKVSKITLYAENPTVTKKFHKYLYNIYKKKLNVKIVNDNTIDITAKKATKAKAVKYLSKKLLGVNLSESAAFGHTETDIELLKLIRSNGGLTISNNNSTKIIQEIAAYMTKDAENDGFAFAIDTILGNNKTVEEDF